ALSQIDAFRKRVFLGWQYLEPRYVRTRVWDDRSQLLEVDTTHRATPRLRSTRAPGFKHPRQGSIVFSSPTSSQLLASRDGRSGDCRYQPHRKLSQRHG